MYYHRGLRIRPEMQEFRLGVQKSQEAIENTIGSKSLVHPYALDELTFSSDKSKCIFNKDNVKLTVGLLVSHS